MPTTLQLDSASGATTISTQASPGDFFESPAQQQFALITPVKAPSEINHGSPVSSGTSLRRISDEHCWLHRAPSKWDAFILDSSDEATISVAPQTAMQGIRLNFDDVETCVADMHFADQKEH